MEALTFLGVSAVDNITTAQAYRTITDDTCAGINTSLDEPKKPRGRGRPRTEHSKPPRFFCTFANCCYGAVTKHRMTEHTRTHFDAKTFECFFCHRAFKSKASLTMHQKKHLGLKPAKCGYCPKRFASAGDRLRHERYIHTKERPYACQHCNAKFVEGNKLTRHQLVHNGRRDFQCQQCTYAAADKFKLIRHLRVHTGEKPYGCSVCHMRFSQQNSMKSHYEAKHCKERTWFYCDSCNARCGRMTDLRKHKQMVHSHNPMSCKTCGKVFPDRYSLRVHRRTHKGQLFRCTLCPFGAASRALLKAHFAKHSGGKKLFACPYCPTTFSSKVRLNKHCREFHLESPLRLRKNELLSCPHCPRSFKYLKCFQQHVLEHDKDTMKIEMMPVKSANVTSEKRVTRLSLKSEEQKREVSTELKLLCCAVCNKEFSKPKWFQKHRQSHYEVEIQEKPEDEHVVKDPAVIAQQEVQEECIEDVQGDLIEDVHEGRIEEVSIQEELLSTHELLFKKGNQKSLVVPIQTSPIDMDDNNNMVGVISASAVLEIIDEMAPAEGDSDIVIQDKEDEEENVDPLAVDIDARLVNCRKKLSFNTEEVERLMDLGEVGELSITMPTMSEEDYALFVRT